MQLGVISDTHDNVAAIEESVELFRDAGVETVIHCGDFIAPLMVPYFEGFELHGVLGNNDGDIDAIEQQFMALETDSQLHGRYAELTVDGLRIFVLHGDQGIETVEEFARTRSDDILLYGHFHAADHREIAGTTVVNPGAHLPITDDSRSVAIVETETGEVSFHEIDG